MKKLWFLLSCLLMVCTSAFAAININSADIQQLQTLKGIGPVKAKAIVEYRTQHGPFKNVDDLKNVPGIGDKTLDKLRPELSIGTAPALTPLSSKGAPLKPAAPAQAQKPVIPAKPAQPAAQHKREASKPSAKP